MALHVANWNSDDTESFMWMGHKCAFAKFTWESGDTYDPTAHATTKPFANGSTAGGEIKPLAGANPIDLWGIRYIHDIIFDAGGGSDATIVTGAAMPIWIRNGQYIAIKEVGCSGTGATLTAVDDTQLDTTTGNLNALIFYGLIIGS